MSLNTLVNYISNSQITSELIKRISKNNELNIVGSSRYAKSIILDSIAKKEKKNILLICPNEEIAYKWIGYFESINNIISCCSNGAWLWYYYQYKHNT